MYIYIYVCMYYIYIYVYICIIFKKIDLEAQWKNKCWVPTSSHFILHHTEVPGVGRYVGGIDFELAPDSALVSKDWFPTEVDH